MAACEDCWGDAYARARMFGGSLADALEGERES